MAATKSIMGGHWQEAYHYLSSLTVWNLIGDSKDTVLDLLKAKLQVSQQPVCIKQKAKLCSLSWQQWLTECSACFEACVTC